MTPEARRVCDTLDGNFWLAFDESGDAGGDTFGTPFLSEETAQRAADLLNQVNSPRL
jgi:hypothetical protein